MIQLDAFEAQAPYQRTSETSREAARKIEPHMSAHERDVLNEIRASGARGCTRKELAESIGWADRQQNRVTGRVDSLIKKQLVREDHEMAYDRLGEPTWQVRRRDGSAVLISTSVRP